MLAWSDVLITNSYRLFLVLYPVPDVRLDVHVFDQHHPASNGLRFETAPGQYRYK